MSHVKETSNVRLLLAEDNAKHLQRATRWLKRYGYEEIVEARSAKEAREILQQEHFDIIIADMRMEADDSGFTIIEEVKKRNITSMVIVLTANDSVDDCRRALNWSGGAWDYISKNMRGNPFEEIHKAIQKAITYLNRWGNSKDEAWISENMAHLLQNYRGQYIAVMNNAVIEAAESEETLQQRIQERKLPLFLTVIKKIDYELYEQLPEKLTVFVEGPTDVRYIETALKIFGQEELLTQIHLDTIGNKMGNKSGGHTNLKSAFDFLKENPKFRHHKVLFLFDPDVTDKQLPNKGKDFENLFVRRMTAHSAMKAGIESLCCGKNL
jgi:CheY-like chemotaxis protein